MHKVFFSSDLHIGHDRPFIYEARGYNSIEEHDKDLVRKWNSVVSKDDTVFLLGDLMMGENHGYGIFMLSQLNGKIHIIAGNNDSKAKLEAYMDELIFGDNGNFYSISDARFIERKIGKVKWHFYLSHYPTLVDDRVFSPLDSNDNPAARDIHRPDYLKMYNLYGHTHQKDNFLFDNGYQNYHVGVDSHDGYPVELTTIIEDIMKQKEKCHEKEY